MDCLITKLKSSVTDSGLEKLGILTIGRKVQQTPTQDTQYTRLMFTEKGTINCVGGLLYKTYGGEPLGSSYTLKDTDYNPTSSMYLFGGYVSNDECSLELPKYTLSGISGLSYQPTPIKDFNFTAVTEFGSAWYKGAVSDIPLRATLVNFNNNQNVSGSLSDFENHINLTSLNVGNTAIASSPLSSLGKLVHLTTLNAYASGSIESFVASQRANGRTTCTGITCSYLSTNVTFNGSAIQNKSNVTLSWTATTITYDGVTIEA